MINNKRIVVILPAYNCSKTLNKVVSLIPKEYVDEIILVDDYSQDDTVAIAKKLPISTYAHCHNLGYGANQKTCYRKALEVNADVVVMLHPDYQYDPRLVDSIASLIAYDVYDVALGSRIIGGNALRNGMPRYKYVANRALTFIQNLFLGAKLSEYHTGFRAFSRKVLMELPLLENSDDFIFDNEIILQSLYFGFKIGEISSSCSYHSEASSINFLRSSKYGLAVLVGTFKLVLQRLKIYKFKIFNSRGRKLLKIENN